LIQRRQNLIVRDHAAADNQDIGLHLMPSPTGRR
jgi:hypothetical protein